MKPVLLSALPVIALLSIAATDPPSQQGVVSPIPPVATAAPTKTAPIAKWRRRRPVSGSLATVAAANRSATREPARQGFVNAAQVYPWVEGLVFQTYTAPGRITDIALQPGETLVAVASGDTVRWVIGDTTSGTGAQRRTHVLVKPSSSGLTTNLVITTDRRSYHLALTSTAATAMSALSWTYPQDELIALRRSAAQASAAEPVAGGLAVDQLRFDYTISGDKPAWRPLRAFDDGRQTFIEFPATLGTGEAPPLFLVDHKGAAQLVNYRLRGRYYVVDRLFEIAELRLGGKRQDIVRIRRTGTKSEDRSS